VFTQFPQPQVVNPQQRQQGLTVYPANMQQQAEPTSPTAAPSSQFGVAVPGMIVAPPPQPGQPQPDGQATQPGQLPAKRPGGGGGDR
jgi:hypothetical protein